MSRNTVLPQRTFASYREARVPVPDLIQNQIDSFDRFLKNGLFAALSDFSPINDYAGKKFSLELTSFELLPAEFDEFYAKENKLTYEGQLKARVKLTNKILGTVHEQEIAFAEIPLMTNHGTFIINGAERAIVPQLARSYGAFIIDAETRKGRFFGAKVIPARGVWIEMFIEYDGALYARIDSKRKFPITVLLRALGMTTNDAILGASDNPLYKSLMVATLAKDEIETADDAFVELYKKMRDGEHAAVENAREFVQAVFSSDRYNLTRVGRFQINKRFGFGLTEKDLASTVIDLRDIVHIIETVATKQHEQGEPDDIDHLAMRRVRYVGEMIEQKIRTGMAQVKRNIQDKMSVIDVENVMPLNLMNQRPLQARIKEFFAQNQLSQFMDQANILSELEHVRMLSALGPGGLTRERAGFEVRDIHPSHYGRVCPIQTPEGPNIGLILHLATYAKINEYGMIETPYIKVHAGKLTGEVVYLNAFEEERFLIAHWGTPVDSHGAITTDSVEVRFDGTPKIVPKKDVQLIDVAANQIFSVATSLIPFIESDDAKRTLMGSNMMKQATPVICPDVPLVGTGMEHHAAINSGRMIVARESGEVSYVDSRKIVVKSGSSSIEYPLVAFQRTNDYSCFGHTPTVAMGQKVAAGDVLADTTTTRNGQLALGQNCLVAFMCWHGNNYEDAIIISERLIKNSAFSTIHIDEYECIVRDTKLGPEQTTADIPNVSDMKLRNLDEDGVVRVGSEVVEGDILVGKITPKGETEISAEERLLRSIFGDKARDVKDSSLRMDYGKRGRVIGVKVFSRERGDDLESGVLKKIYIEIAQIRHVKVGDKLAGRHGNKGVISVVLPEEDMPYMADGTPVDVILTPMGVPGRMNIGQIFEMHLGLAAHTLGYQAIVPPFSGASEAEIKQELTAAGFDPSGKVTLYDGLTGEAFDQPIAVGYMYILKLHHMVDDKMHARAVGPYSLITQQPLGGKSQSGGQRFGEMEVWALEGYGAAYTLREMLTIKSDDIQGRSETFDAIIRGNRIGQPHTPASFKVLINYLRGLSFDIRMNYGDSDAVNEFEAVKPEVQLDIDPELLLVDEEGSGVDALSEFNPDSAQEE